MAVATVFIAIDFLSTGLMIGSMWWGFALSRGCVLDLLIKKAWIYQISHELELDLAKLQPIFNKRYQVPLTLGSTSCFCQENSMKSFPPIQNRESKYVNPIISIKYEKWIFNGHNNNQTYPFISLDHVYQKMSNTAFTTNPQQLSDLLYVIQSQ